MKAEMVRIDRKKKKSPNHVLRHELKMRPALKAFAGSKKKLRKMFKGEK